MKLKCCFLLIILFMLSITGTAMADRMAISADIANIRSGPGADNDILWKAEQNYPLMVIEKSGKWYHFRDYEGDEGWVHQSLVDKFESVITKGEKNNVRSGPGTQFDKSFMVEDGIPFKVIQRKGAWINIEHSDGDRGWIHKSLVW